MPGVEDEQRPGVGAAASSDLNAVGNILQYRRYTSRLDHHAEQEQVPGEIGAK